jgi:N-acetylneuraminic acid mutarotase
VSSTVFCYLTTEDRWERLSDKPTPVADVKGALIGEKVYIPGGRLADGSQTDILEIYDPRQNTWETGKPLPKPISAYAMTDFEGKLYLFGGWDGEKAQSGVFIYDPEEDVWEEGTQMPTRRYLASAANINEKIYVVGGRNSNGSLDNLELYYPQRDLDGDLAWDNQLLVPESIKNLTVIEISGYLYIIGQNDSSDIQIYNFDEQNNEWILINTKINEINTETFGIVSMDGKLIFLGGMDNQKILSNNVESYRVLFTIVIPIINQ